MNGKDWQELLDKLREQAQEALDRFSASLTEEAL